jgi:hypothetical protein
VDRRNEGPWIGFGRLSRKTSQRQYKKLEKGTQDVFGAHALSSLIV